MKTEVLFVMALTLVMDNEYGKQGLNIDKI